MCHRDYCRERMHKKGVPGKETGCFPSHMEDRLRADMLERDRAIFLWGGHTQRQCVGLSLLNAMICVRRGLQPDLSLSAGKSSAPRVFLRGPTHRTGSPGRIRSTGSSCREGAPGRMRNTRTAAERGHPRRMRNTQSSFCREGYPGKMRNIRSSHYVWAASLFLSGILRPREKTKDEYGPWPP